MSDFNWTTDGPTGSSGFDTGFHTDWFVIRSASQPGAGAAEAMEKLCRTYWYPLYAYVRRQGHDSHDAQDLTQGFFARLLTQPGLQDLHPSKGKFRAFLLASMNHFLANEWRRDQAQKRGGGRPVFSLDAAEAEDRYRFEPSHHEGPDRVFERAWATTLLKRVRTQLQQECMLTGKSDLFEELKEMFDGEANPSSYAEMAVRLNTSEVGVKKAAQRLRERFGDLLRAEVGQTVDASGDVDEEIRHLFSVLIG
jgi:DNA-directed RNA polymerase specialized sigma24 family protein